MTPQSDRLALLRAIGAAPDDDTPRLVFADWLDEHGTTDADHARAEFLRIACRSRPKVRITKAEQKWLAAHWQRMLPAVVARFAELGAREEWYVWCGRHLAAWVFNRKTHADVSVGLEFWRGFVRSIVYAPGYDRVAAAVAADEPLARHTIRWGLPNPWRLANGHHRVGLLPSVCFGQPVWDRVSGHAAVREHRGQPEKLFEQPAGPDSRKDLIGRVYAAITAAMTAHARSLAGWPEDLPTLG
jgi:uncharacterized protein (TIGR02996 family)